MSFTKFDLSISEEMRKSITEKLHQAEINHGVRILFAIKSGNRA